MPTRVARIATDQGYALAQNNLGVIYRDSLGVLRDLDQALARFRKAAAGGNPLAQQSLRHLESRDRGMSPWSNILEGQSVRVAISGKGWVYLFGDLTARLPTGSMIEVSVLSRRIGLPPATISEIDEVLRGQEVIAKPRARAAIPERDPDDQWVVASAIEGRPSARGFGPCSSVLVSLN